MIDISEKWKSTYPGAHAGILVMRGLENPTAHPRLQSLKAALEAQLRDRFPDRAMIDTDPHITAYGAYYKQFRKTYPVQGQLESVVFKGKSIPSVAALVEAMFMAELKNRLLTAGHDLDRLELPVTINVADGAETYTLLRGEPQALKAGDMYMADGAGVIASVIYGPDQRTQINPATHNALFVVYAPDGIGADAVRSHLEDIRRYAQIVAPDSQTDRLEVFAADAA